MKNDVSVEVLIKSGQMMTIRELKTTDETILGDYFESLSEHTTNMYSPHPFDRETAAKLCSEADDPVYRRIVATVDGTNGTRMIAYAILTLGLLEGDVNRYQKYGYCLNRKTDCRYAPSVADDYQNQGVGSLMLEAVVSYAIECGKTRMILQGGVRNDNQRAIAYYLKNGFVKVGDFDKSMDMIKQLVHDKEMQT